MNPEIEARLLQLLRCALKARTLARLYRARNPFVAEFYFDQARQLLLQARDLLSGQA